MFLNKLGSYDTVDNYVDYSGCIHESMSYNEFMYQMTLVESAVLDLANRTATILCENQSGILTEAAAGEALNNAKDKIVGILNTVRDAIVKFINTIKQKLMETNRVRSTWLAANKGKILNAKVNPKTTIKINSTLAQAVALPEINFSFQNIQTLSKKQIFSSFVPKVPLLGVNLDDAASVKSALENGILGKPVVVTVVDLDRNYLMKVAVKGDEMAKALERSAKDLDSAIAKLSQKTDDAQDVHEAIENVKWASQLIKSVASVYMKACTDAFNLCGMFVNTANKTKEREV